MEILFRLFKSKKEIPLKEEDKTHPKQNESNTKKNEFEEEIVVIQEPSGARPIVYFISGGIGGMCSIVTGHPFDTIKVKLQTMPKPKKGRPPLYTGTVDCAIKIVQKYGLLGFYKGMSVPITAITPVFAICFFAFGLGKSIQEAAGGNLGNLSAFQLFLAGSFSGIFTTFIITPVERIKLLLQIQEESGVGRFKGPMDACYKLYKRGGIKNLYKGTVATLMRDIPATGVYFMTYELLTRQMAVAEEDHPLKLSKIILAGGIAGMANWAIGMPADIIKSRLQSAPDGVYPNGFRDVFKELYAEEGLLSLFKGIIPVMLRAFPSNAACFAGFELCRNSLNSYLTKNKDSG